MKMFVLSLLILALIVGFGIFYTDTVRDICGEMVLISDNIDDLVSACDTVGASAQTVLLEKEWAKKTRSLSMLMDHKYLSDVKISIDKLYKSLEYGDLSSAAQNNAAIRAQLEDIVCAGRVTIANLL